jgi:ABC-type sulfate/molybdate transport systems ATPase subunit
MPNSGSVQVLGQKVQTRKERLVLDESKAGWVPQLDDLQGMLNVEENIGHHILRMEAEAREKRIGALVQAMHLGPYAKQKVKQLSGGQRQRVSIAKAMAGMPPVLLMDESLAQLDLRTKSAILLDLKAMVRQEGVAAILVLHDPADALMIADELWVVENHKLVRKAPPKEVVEDPQSYAIAGLFDYVNVVPKGAELPGDWRLEGEEQWLYAHELPDLPWAPLDSYETPSGKVTIWIWEGLKLIQK